MHGPGPGRVQSPAQKLTEVPCFILQATLKCAARSLRYGSVVNVCLVSQNIRSGRGFGKSCTFSPELSAVSSARPAQSLRTEPERVADGTGHHTIPGGERDSGECPLVRHLGKEVLCAVPMK